MLSDFLQDHIELGCERIISIYCGCSQRWAFLFPHGSLFYDLQISAFFNGVYSIGSLSVYIFFFVSGYLNFQSWSRSAQWTSFGVKRALRIFPGLLVAAFVSVFVVGGLMTTLDSKDFFASEQTWTLFANYASAWATRNDLPGVFADNPIPYAVNGSLWTIKYEIMMYVLLVVFGMTSALSRRVLVGAVVVSAAAFLLVKVTALDEGAITWRDFWQFAAIFFAGAAFNYLPLHRRHWLIAPMLAGFVIACTSTNLAVVQGGVFLCLPCAVYLVAYWKPLTRIRLRHDLSYGIYIYAFPVQQAITELSLKHGFSKPLCLAMALGIVTMLALGSWVLVERPAIAWSRSLVTSFRRRQARLLSSGASET